MKSFGLPSHSGSIFWLQFYRQDDPGAIPHHQKQHRGGGGLLRWAPKIPPSPFVNGCTKQVIPNWWVSGGEFIFIYMASFLQLQVETPTAASYNAEHTSCGSFGMSGNGDVTLLSENFAVLWLAFLHCVVAAVEVMSSTPNSALLNRGFVIHFSV